MTTDKISDFETVVNSRSLDALQQPVAANVDWGGNKITNLAPPTAGPDAARKSYVDGVIVEPGLKLLQSVTTAGGESVMELHSWWDSAFDSYRIIWENLYLNAAGPTSLALRFRLGGFTPYKSDAFYRQVGGTALSSGETYFPAAVATQLLYGTLLNSTKFTNGGEMLLHGNKSDVTPLRF